MKETENKNIINDDEETFDQRINWDNTQVNTLIKGKINDFKLKLIKQYNYFEENFFICIITFNIVIYSWERKIIFKILILIVMGFFLLWVFLFEKYSTAYNLLVEKDGTNK